MIKLVSSFILLTYFAIFTTNASKTVQILQMCLECHNVLHKAITQLCNIQSETDVEYAFIVKDFSCLVYIDAL